MEKTHGVVHRWVPSDREYIEHEHILNLRKQEVALLQLLKACNRRSFLLKLKKKYAGLTDM